LFSSIRDKLVFLLVLSCVIPASVVIWLFSAQLSTTRSSFAETSSHVLIERAKMMMGQYAVQQAESVELKLASLENEARVLSRAAETAYSRPQPWKSAYPERAIIKDKSGAYYGEYRTPDDGDLFISGTNSLTPQVRHEVMVLEELTPVLMQIGDQHEEVIYTYVLTRDSIVRGYPAAPPIPDTIAEGVLDPYSDFTGMPFYAVADEKNNPTHSVKWTDVYLDPGGNGWMFSVCAPIYVENEMKGVAALDITTKHMVEQILDLKVGESGYAFLMNSTNGTVLGFPKSAASDLGWKKGMAPDELNLFTNEASAFYKAQSALRADQPMLKRLMMNGTPKYAYMQPVGSTGFRIVLVVGESELIDEIRQANNEVQALAKQSVNKLLGIALLVLIGSLIVALRYSNKLVKPLTELTHSAKQVAHGDFDYLVNIKSNDELGVLSKSFNQMVVELREREEEQMALTEQLRQQNEELEYSNRKLNRLIDRLNESEESKERFQALSYTDELTGVYNRRYLEEHVTAEFAEHRDVMSYACIMLDIDDFKAINDTYGHLAGDHVLRDVADILLQNKRLHDVVVRYAGDEFVVLVEQVDKERASQIAERIRAAVEVHTSMFEDTMLRVTVSVGVAFIETGEPVDGDQILREADNALYKAKQLGRNRVIMLDTSHHAA